MQSSSTATKLNLELKETPQSVTVITQERIKDQNLQTIGDVLNNSTGISQSTYDSERTTYWSRGFRVGNFMFDGIPTTIDATGTYIDTNLDSSIYERVEVIRGANGLLTGAGDPSAAVNFVRKHATSDVFTATITGGGGTWNNWRGTADISTPLTKDGSVRGRIVTTLQDTESQLDRYSNEKKLFYGVIDADLGPNTLLSFGYDYQEARPNGVTWGGFPLWNSAGQRLDWSRSFNPAPAWSYWDTTNHRAFASLEHKFDSGWTARVVGAHAETESNAKLGGIQGWPNPATGAGTFGLANWYIMNRKVDSVDAYVSGPFELFGRQHELVFGASASRQQEHTKGTNFAMFAIDNAFTFNGSVPEPNWGPLNDQGTNTVYQKGLYATAKLNITDQFKVLLGGRFADWRTTGANSAEEHKFIPYLGAVYDLTDTYSIYASYTGVFNPQTYKDSSGAYLAPLEGVNYEAGIKASYLDGRLNASLAVFRTEQDNVAVVDGSNMVPGTTQQAYLAASGTVSTGFEVEVNGAVTDRWNVGAGFAHYSLEGPDGTSINTDVPRSTLKLFTAYTPPILDDKLVVGGGVRWQSKTYQDATGPLGVERVGQDAYALVDLFARYNITSNLQAQVNVSNLFDEKYYSQIGFYNQGSYGAGRSVFASLSYKY